MAMFEERPYRQKKQSLWSIWWFVGLMASGLTAWHLELIPFGNQQTVGIQFEDEDFVRQDNLPDNSIVKSTTEPAEDSRPQPSTSEKRKSLGQLYSSEPPEPPGIESQSEPAFGVSVASYVSQQNAPIEQASYKQPIPGQVQPATEPPSIQQSTTQQPPSPFFKSKEEFVPVQTLTYREKTDPVDITQIPTARPPVPVQYANHQNNANHQQTGTSNTPNRPDQVASPSAALQNLKKPFQLTPEAKQLILRHRELSSLYWHEPERRPEIAVELEKLARKIYFSPEIDFLPAYEVQPNDQLRVIARQYDVPWEYLANLNRTKPEQIRPGQKLKMIKGPFDAVVDLNDHRITIHAHGYYVCSFPVGTGKDHSSPTGKFPVLDKVRNPTYYGSAKTIGRDDPLNPLGEYWIDLGNGYGIHGTINPESIGKSESKGCIRMNNADVAQVFDLLTTKSVITIRQ